MTRLDARLVKARNPIERVIPELLNEQPIDCGPELKVRCPFHEDGKPSLRMNPEKQSWICDPCDVGGDVIRFVERFERVDFQTALARLAQRAGLEPAKAARRELRAYDYRDEAGTLLYQSVRFEPKDFRQRRPDGQGGWAWTLNGTRRVVYRLPELKGREAVCIVEGEKDADRLWQLTPAVPATCNVGGASKATHKPKWRDEYTQQIKNQGVKRVAVIADNDEAGRAHAEAIARSCQATGLEVRLIPALPDVPEKGDVSDYLETHSREELLALIKGTPVYVSAAVASSAHDESEPAAVDGPGLFEAIERYIRRYVVLSAEQAVAVVLWAAHTHTIDAADCTPYLSIGSATKQSGKTRLLEVLEPIVPRPWLTGRVSAAVLVRKTDAERPTLLLDESDAALKVDSDYSEALRGLLNTGYRRSGKASLCIGQGANLSYRDFSTFGAKAIAGIGALPDTVADRAIPITLRRRAASETVARWRNREGRQEAATLATALAAWGRSALESLRQARPALPDALSDRAGDCWEPLLAIADLMGGEWPQRARQAAVALMGAVEDSDPGIELLKDLHEILAESDDETIPTTDLIEKLTALEDRPWATWNHGRSMTPNALARQLKRFGILPAGKVRLSPQKVARSYRRALFEDAFARYLPFKAEQRNKPNENGPELPLSKWNNDPSCSAFKTEISPINTGLCSTVPLSTPDMSTREHSDDADGEYYNG